MHLLCAKWSSRPNSGVTHKILRRKLAAAAAAAAAAAVTAAAAAAVPVPAKQELVLQGMPNVDKMQFQVERINLVSRKYM